MTAMRFPSWVDEPTDDTERARNRLKYMLNSAARELCENGSICDLARAAGVDRTTIYYAMRKARIGTRLADQLQRGAGKAPDGTNRLNAEQLINPLGIASE